MTNQLILYKDTARQH